MIFGLTIQELGDVLELRCPECVRLGAPHASLAHESEKSSIRIYCTAHRTFGEWTSEEEMEREKFDLARQIGLL